MVYVILYPIESHYTYTSVATEQQITPTVSNLGSFYMFTSMYMYNDPDLDTLMFYQSPLLHVLGPNRYSVFVLYLAT